MCTDMMYTGKYAYRKSYYNSIMLCFRWRTHCRSGKYVALWSIIISNIATTGKFSTCPMLGVTLLLEVSPVQRVWRKNRSKVTF